MPGERNPWLQGNDVNYSGIETKKRILLEKDIDIMNTEEMIQSQELQGVTESLYPHSSDNMRILIRRGKQIPYYIYLFMVFRDDVWYYFIAMIVVGLIAWYVLGSTMYASLVDKCINLLRMVTGGALPYTSNRNHERIFIACWLLYALIMITAFTSNLTTVLMQDRFYPNYDTLEELDQAGVVIAAYGTQIKELTKAFNGTSKFSLIRRMKQMPDIYDNLNTSLNNFSHLLLEFTKQYPVVVNTERGIFVTRHKLLLNVFHLVKESPLPNYMAYQLPFGSPLLDQLNSDLRKVIEAGLIKSWRSLQDHECILTNIFSMPEDLHVERTQAYPISLNHLQAAFLILGTGLTISGIVFLVELFHFRLNIWFIKTQNIIFVK